MEPQKAVCVFLVYGHKMVMVVDGPRLNSLLKSLEQAKTEKEVMMFRNQNGQAERCLDGSSIVGWEVLDKQSSVQLVEGLPPGVRLT